MKSVNKSGKYLDSHEKEKSLFNNWILPALIFIVLIAVVAYTYLVTVGRY